MGQNGPLPTCNSVKLLISFFALGHILMPLLIQRPLYGITDIPELFDLGVYGLHCGLVGFVVAPQFVALFIPCGDWELTFGVEKRFELPLCHVESA